MPDRDAPPDCDIDTYYAATFTEPESYVCACNRDTFTVCPAHTGYTDAQPIAYPDDFGE